MSDDCHLRCPSYTVTLCVRTHAHKRVLAIWTVSQSLTCHSSFCLFYFMVLNHLPSSFLSYWSDAMLKNCRVFQLRYWVLQLCTFPFGSFAGFLALCWHSYLVPVLLLWSHRLFVLCLAVPCVSLIQFLSILSLNSSALVYPWIVRFIVSFVLHKVLLCSPGWLHTDGSPAWACPHVEFIQRSHHVWVGFISVVPGTFPLLFVSC